jgi:ABC-type nitrate/sulfonate/bicarbonate transport system substrate-binding protein
MGREFSRRAALRALAGSFAALTVTSARAADKLRVGKAVVENIGFIPLDVGLKYGLFEKQGLEIEAINFTGGAKVAQAVAAGAVDISLSGGPDMAYAAKGAPQIAIATISASPAFMGISVGKESPARTIDDLKGKRIGVTSNGSLTFWLAEELNRVKGWTNEQDRALPTAIGGSATSAFAALKAGQIDASIGSTQAGYQLEEQQQGRLLLNISEYVTRLELFVTFASTTIIQQNPDAVRRFLKGWYETVAFMKSHKAETMQVSSEVIGFSLAIADRSYDSLISQYSTDGRFEPKAVDKLVSSFVDLKLVDNPADIAKFYTEEFLPKG